MFIELLTKHALKPAFFYLPAALLGLHFTMSVKTVVGAVSETVPRRLLSVPGLGTRCNDVIYSRCPSPSKIDSRVVFFGGDVQDYPENMLSHRDNRRHVSWNLEATATILADAFPKSDILIIKPSRMYLRTFSCYDNFVESNLTGVPTHSPEQYAHKHLLELVRNAVKMIDGAGLTEETISKPNNTENSCPDREGTSLILIGFSKGCVVLNQLVYELHHLAVTNEMKEFISKVKSMYWLDCGHAGGSNVWITESRLLESLANTGIHLHVHVTPYQIEDGQRPWIRKEEKIFTEKLRKMKANITRQLHFEGETPSIEIHFSVLKEFNKSS